VQDLWKRRRALDIVSQLPEEMADALSVLEFAKQLIQEFLTDQTDDSNQRLARSGGADIIRLSASSNSSLIRPGR
jgi:hypothetical protein